jgi:hypothetical protein
MKYFFYCAAFLLASQFVNAQADKVFLHNGKVLEVKVLRVGEQLLYKYPKEDVENSISKFAVSKVLYSSGREESITDKIIVTSEKDYENVIILQKGTSLTGLKRLGDVKGKDMGTALANMNKVKTRAENEIKKEAAKIGGVFLLLDNYQVTDSQPSIAYGKTNITGTAYSY